MTSLRKHVSVTYGNESDIFNLTVVDEYKYFFKVHNDNGFERNQEQVLAIMENQHRILGELIDLVKEKKKDV